MLELISEKTNKRIRRRRRAKRLYKALTSAAIVVGNGEGCITQRLGFALDVLNVHKPCVCWIKGEQKSGDKWQNEEKKKKKRARRMKEGGGRMKEGGEKSAVAGRRRAGQEVERMCDQSPNSV